jgi:PKD repeat protein
MKRHFITILLSLSFVALMAGSGYDVTYNQPATGVHELNFNLDDFSVSDLQIAGITYSNIEFEGSIYTTKKGFAQLPYLNSSLIISDDKNVSLDILGGEYTDIELANPLLPSRGVIYRDQDPSTIPYEISPRSLKDEWYPKNTATSTDPFIINDFRGTTVYVYPFKYNAVTQTLRVYKNITVKLIENNTTAINPLQGSDNHILKEMNSIYSSLFINYSNAMDDLTIGEYGDILVICTSRDEEAIQPYIEWKMEKGFNVSMEVVETGTNVKTLIQDSYDANNNLLYVQLVGDWADIKSDIISNNSAPTDPQLGCVVGSDDHPDITVGRISANSAEDVTVQVNKIIQYEKNPEMGGTWYKGALGVASNEGSGNGDDGEMDKTHSQIIYDDKLDPFTFDSYYTSYQPGDNAQQVYDALDAGISVINYTGHGYAQGWSTSGFSNSHVASTTNGDQLPWVVSVACNNGDFHGSSDCYAEAWQRKEGGGSIMFLGATISQPWQPPMRGQDYFADILIGGYNYDEHPGQSGINTTEGRTTFGAIVFNGLVLMTTESGSNSDWETAKTWIMFGDPSMQPRTDTPAELNISSNVVLVGAPFTTTITGPDGAVEGAMVCLSKDGEYFSALTDATGAVSFTHTLTPGTAKLVVTGFNTETIYEEVTVVPPGGAYVIVNSCEVNDADGNNNGQADYGETILLDVMAENVGSDNATNVTATISSTDEFITINNNSYNFGNIDAGATANAIGAFEITVAEDAPDGHSAFIEIVFNGDGDGEWEGSMSIALHAAVLEMGEYTISDPTGNNNGKIDPGETVLFTINVENNGTSDAYNVFGELICVDPFLTIESDPLNYESIGAGLSGEQVFTATADINTPTGHATDLSFLMTGDMGVNGTASFVEVIGQIPVLIIDLDGNTNSASEMEDAMAAYDMVAEYATSLPEDLSLYSSIFVCLGIYSDNHTLSSSEGQALADFLNQGGNLYMEGGDTWYYDTQTAVHAMFSVNATGDGSDDLSTLLGVTETFTDGMSFDYSGDNNWIDHIEASGAAEVIFNNQNPAYGTAVANDAGTYKTIAASHEFGGLQDGESTKAELMEAYLQFFGFTNTLTAIFGSDETEICEEEMVSFFDMSAGDVTSWEWTFEGGYPSNSVEQNPQIVYMEAGTYDVTLTISDGTDSNTLTIEDYITVDVCSDIKNNIFSEFSVYPNPNSGIFTVEFGDVLSEDVTIKVLNTLGSTVFESQDISVYTGYKQTIDLGENNKGMYFLVIENYQGSTINRIIIR